MRNISLSHAVTILLTKMKSSRCKVTAVEKSEVLSIIDRLRVAVDEAYRAGYVAGAKGEYAGDSDLESAAKYSLAQVDMLAAREADLRMELSGLRGMVAAVVPRIATEICQSDFKSFNAPASAETHLDAALTLLCGMQPNWVSADGEIATRITQAREHMDHYHPTLFALAPPHQRLPLSDDEIAVALNDHGVETMQFAGNGDVRVWTTSGSQDVSKIANCIRTLAARG